jgi:CDP-diacylglycerol--glycerol-3-phosphate 3-phosphatidyltransferase
MTTSPGESAQAETILAAARPRERFWNAPNTITVIRMGAVPALLLLPWMTDPRGSAIIAWAFIIAATTDIVDGWLARRGQQVTSIGKLLDPLADKLLVTTSLIVLLAVGRLPEWSLILVVVIVGRELAVTGLRGIAGAGGHVIAAGAMGKLKAFTQNVAIGCLLFANGTLGLPNHAIGLTLLALATLLTLWSGYRYFAQYFGSEAPRG